MKTAWPLHAGVAGGFFLLGLGGCFASRAEISSDLPFPAAWRALEMNVETPRTPGGEPVRPAEAWTLDRLLTRLVRANRDLASAFEAWKAAESGTKAAGWLPEPQAMVGAFLEPVETRVGPQRWNLRLAQKIPLSRRLDAEERVAAARAEAAGETFRQKALDALAKLRDALAELEFVRRSIEIERSNMGLLRDWLRVIEARYRVDRNAHADLVRVQVEIGKLEDRIEQLREFEVVRLAAVNSLLDLPSATPIRLAFDPLSDDEDLEKPKELPELEKEVEESHPALSEVRALEEAAKAQVDLAHSTRIPDLEVALRYLVTGDARTSGVSGSGDDPLALELGMRLPIQGGRYSALERQAERIRRSLHERLFETRNRLRLDLRSAHFRFMDGRRREGLYRKVLLPKAKESVQVSLAAFRANKQSFLELLDAQRIQLDFELALERARADRAKGAALLHALTGGRSFAPKVKSRGDAGGGSDGNSKESGR